MSEQLQILIKWFNQVEDNHRDDLMRHINSIAFFPEKDIFNKFKELRNEIVNLIATGQEKDTILQKLTVGGMEEGTGNVLFKYCSSLLNPVRDCQMINSLELDGLKNVMDFIINKMFIYREYGLYPFNTLVKAGNFRNKTEAHKVLRFLHKIIYQVATREISPDTFKIILLNVYDLSPDSVEIISNLLKTNANELHQAQLFYIMDQVQDKLEEEEQEDDDVDDEVAEEDQP
ncbi:MAG TPA: hypothetical protein VFC58_00050 [Desulfosporosinus sp.]|nr:hypothetical protein [Desulfosporosinus sp.]